jgi:7,8-dihydroneopterin aldolase/epimerase/oxygenase
MPDRIVIKDLEVETQIGVSNEERARPQRLLVTVEMERDLAHAGRTDMESATTPYDVVANLIRQALGERPRKLIEAAADAVADAILSRRLAVSVKVEIKKFSVPRCQYVSVQVERHQ